MTKRKRLAKALAFAVNGGVMDEGQAMGLLCLAQHSGFFASRTGDENHSSIVRDKGLRMSKVKKRSDPASVSDRAKKLFNGARVKDAADRLSNTKHAIKNPRTGKPLTWGNRDVETQSEREKAVVGVWFKHMLRKGGVPGIVLTDFEKSLLHETVTKGKWVGEVGGVYYGGGADPSDFVPNAVVKQALLDDTTSGGLYLTPYEYDTNIVTIPLLSGEVFPMVDVVPVTARRIEGGKMQNLTLAWGTAPGTAITEFDATSLVSELSTTVFPVAGAVELDNNMLADSPVNVGGMVTSLYGERLKAELDKVVISGDGTTQPLGILNASGLTAVNSDNGNGGPPTVSDYEGLIFSVPKQYRTKDWNPAFVMNDTTYRRARGIQVGPGDERRVFGMDEETYTLLDYAAKIQNDVSNSKIIFGCWKRYRMFQRLGSEVVVTREGRQLNLTNTTLVVIRARFGGQPIDTNGFAVMTDAQS